MNLELKRLGAGRAKEIFRKFQESGELPNDTDRELRAILLDPLKNVIDRSGNPYATDLEVGITLYNLLPVSEIGLRTAADTNFWRYVSLLVVPDLVQKRWPGKDDRFWSHKRRIWLKTIWWYLHLSWQGKEDTTRAVLNNHTTDEIVQLVERTGGKGYRVALYREIMRQSKNTNNKEFRKVMKLNTARLMTTEPELAEGGIEGYVKRLYATVH